MISGVLTKIIAAAFTGGEVEIRGVVLDNAYHINV
jgi:hypothetical protein